MYLDHKTKNLQFLHDVYYEYICIIAPKDMGIARYEQIYTENPVIFVVKSQMEMLVPIIKLLFPSHRIRVIPSILQFKTENVKYIIFYISPELSQILDTFSKENKFLILDFPKSNDIYRYIYLTYPEIKLDKMNIADITSINTNRTVYTFQLSKSFIINKNTNINNFIESIFQRFEYIRLYHSSKYYRIPMQSFSPEMILKLNIIPLHPEISGYLKELGVITNDESAICKNTISTIKCNPMELEENSFKLMGFN